MPRLAALEVLEKVLNKTRPLDEALEDNERLPTLDVRDRAFARQLVMTTLRRKGQIDDLIQHALSKPLPPSASKVTNILRIGIAQLMFLDVADHAAVDTSVRLAEEFRLHGFKKLINAILRRTGREGPKIIELQNAPRLNTPFWLWQNWAKAYGDDVTADIARAHETPAKLDITAKTDAQAWAEKLGGEILPTGTIRLDHRGTITTLEGFDDGAWWVQDAAAAIPATLLGDIAGKTVLDLCAAPGGKTLQLAAQGAHVIALDRSKNRIKRLQQNLQRTGLTAETVVADGASWTADQKFSHILLDAPCSATGTIRRHPDAAWLKKPEDVDKLAATQARILDAAINLLEPGGTLIYCTCSLQTEEGPDQINRVLADGLVERNPIRPDEVGGLSDIVTGDGDVRTLPCHLSDLGGLDGFFIARLVKVQ